MNFTKHSLLFLVLLFTSFSFSQNKFREGSNLIINGSTLQEAFYQCVEKLGKPTADQTDDKLITSYCFNTPNGNIIFGKDSITKKIEGAIIFIKSETESDWISNYIDLNSNAENGHLILKSSNLRCVKYVGGNKKILLVAFGDIEFSGKIPMKLD